MLVKYEDLDFYFVQDHYDLHLSGIAYYNNVLYKFDTIYTDEKEIYSNLTELTFVGKIVWLYRKKLFEICVGKHWSKPFTEQFRYRSKFHKFLFGVYYKLPKFLK